ncbi:hypothetical protein OG21DRAFT_1601214 [Imleria badia]|nr:hypothetical protein OG21DRAFT_1601214 [Imleria badia]
MFLFYRLFHRVNSIPSGPSSSTPPSSDQAKDRAIIVWFAVFGASLFFRPAVELAIRILLFSACALLIATIDGSLNLLVGHAVFRAAKYDGYEPPLLSSIEAGSLGGIILIGPTTLATVYLIALLGGLKVQRALSFYITFLLEVASVVTVSAAACSLGVTIVQVCTHPDNGPPLDTTHAARAGALGACIFTVPIVSTAAFFMREAQTMPSARNEPITPPPYLADNLDHPVNYVVSRPRTRHVITHTSAETVGYVLVTLCILTIRLLCF